MNSDKIKKWQKILYGQTNEMTEILERRFIFQQFEQIVANNSSINQANIFYDYYRINYIYAQIIQLSRMLDQNPRVESLNNFLEDIENNSEVFNREWRDEILKIIVPPEAIQNFGNPLGFIHLEEKTLNLELISEDRCNLLCRFVPIKKYRDRQIAHKQTSGQRPNLTFGKLDQFIDFIHERILVYVHFLHGSGDPEDELMSVIAYDWKSIFRVPWINK